MDDKDAHDDTNDRAKLARKGSPFLTTKEAAFYLGLKPNTLVKMRMRGEGPKYRKHGTHVFYHIDELNAWSAALSK